MCGIIAAAAQRDVTPILLEGLKQLEYRGYDSAGIAVIDANQQLQRCRSVGKVSALETKLQKNPLSGKTGLAHTRWATHGKPSENNAHPHFSNDELAVVHNGIIENYLALREQLLDNGYIFLSDTDTEVIGHWLHHRLKTEKNFLAATQQLATQLEGTFSVVFMHRDEPGRLLAVRSGSPLILGLGIGENFLASSNMALLPVTQRFVYLEEGDIADVRCDQYSIYNAQGKKIERPVHLSHLKQEVTKKGKYRHFMQKEIFEQPQAVMETLEERLGQSSVPDDIFGAKAKNIFKQIRRIQIAACGTSYHAGLIARHWLEAFARIPCQVETASEFRYRESLVEPNTLFLTLSQSGETADTLAALRLAKSQGYLVSLTLCNVPESSLVHESDAVLLTRAGPEIGVASTKAFTTQLTALLLLTAVLSKYNTANRQHYDFITPLKTLPKQLQEVLVLDTEIKKLAKLFADKQSVLFIARGIYYPIALEAALKLKEISYIHAEAYPAGELKHGPLALIDSKMLVVVLMPKNELFEKLNSNVQEIRARGGHLLIFTDQSIQSEPNENITVIKMPTVDPLIAPFTYIVPLQLLAYHVAILKGTDVDQPRNLAKSVTVE